MCVTDCNLSIFFQEIKSQWCPAMCSDPLSVLHQVPECPKHHPLMDCTSLWSQGLIKNKFVVGARVARDFNNAMVIHSPLGGQFYHRDRMFDRRSATRLEPLG